MPIDIKDLAIAARDGSKSASDMYLHVEGRGGALKGEGSVKGHVGDIQISTWTWGVAAGSALGSGSATARRAYRNLVVTKGLDSSTTSLVASLATNAELRKVNLTVRKAGGDALDYLLIELASARVVDVDLSVDAAGTPVERVTFSFTKVTITYTPQAGTGSGAGATSFQDEVLVQ